MTTAPRRVPPNRSKLWVPKDTETAVIAVVVLVTMVMGTVSGVLYLVFATGRFLGFCALMFGISVLAFRLRSLSIDLRRMIFKGTKFGR